MISIQVKLFGRTILDFFQQFPFGIEKNEEFLAPVPEARTTVGRGPDRAKRRSPKPHYKGSVKSKCTNGFEFVDHSKKTYARKLTLEQKEFLKWTVLNRPDIKDKEIGEAFDVSSGLITNVRKGRLYKAIDAVEGGPYGR